MRPYARSTMRQQSLTVSVTVLLLSAGLYGQTTSAVASSTEASSKTPVPPHALLYRSAIASPQSDSASTSCPEFSYHHGRTNRVASHRGDPHTRTDHSGRSRRHRRRHLHLQNRFRSRLHCGGFSHHRCTFRSCPQGRVHRKQSAQEHLSPSASLSG